MTFDKEIKMFQKLLMGMIVSVAFVFAQEPAATYTYVGTKMCKMCHNKEETGKQFAIWEKSLHGNALATLKTEEAKRIAVTKGIKTAPDQTAECIQCHVTGFGDASGYQLIVDVADAKDVAKNEKMENVGCEMCHGPGSGYKTKKTMEAVSKGEIEPASVGLIAPTAATCEKCHNEKSPTHKKFVFEEAVKIIAHPNPAKKL